MAARRPLPRPLAWEDDFRPFFEALHDAKEETGISWDAVAAFSGVSTTALDKWRCGRDLPSSVQQVEGLARAFSDSATPGYRSAVRWLEVVDRARRGRRSATHGDGITDEWNRWSEQEAAVVETRRLLKQAAFAESDLPRRYAEIDKAHALPARPDAAPPGPMAQAWMKEHRPGGKAPSTSAEHLLLATVRRLSVRHGVDVPALLGELLFRGEIHPSQRGLAGPLPPVLQIVKLLSECDCEAEPHATETALAAAKAVVDGIDKAAYYRRLSDE